MLRKAVGVGVSGFPEKSVTKVYGSTLYIRDTRGGWVSNIQEKETDSQIVRGAAFSPLANSPPAISPAANSPSAKSPPPAAIRPPPPSHMPITFLLIIIIVVVLHGRP